MGSLDNHVNNLSELFVCNCLNKSNQQIKNMMIKTYTQDVSHAQKDQNSQ